MNIVGERIRAKRQERGLDLAELAATLKVSAATLSRWETGEIDMRWQQIVAASVALNVTVADLVMISTTKGGER